MSQQQSSLWPDGFAEQFLPARHQWSALGPSDAVNPKNITDPQAASQLPNFCYDRDEAGSVHARRSHVCCPSGYLSAVERRCLRWVARLNGGLETLKGRQMKLSGDCMRLIRSAAMWVVWNVPCGSFAPKLTGFALNSKTSKFVRRRI